MAGSIPVTRSQVSPAGGELVELTGVGVVVGS